MLPQELNHGGNEPTPKSQKLHRGTKNDRIYRILLSHPEGTLTKYKISKLAHAQQTQVSLLLHDLERSHLVSDTRVTNYKGLIRKWSLLHIKFQSQSYMLPDVLDVLKKTKLEYALTTYRAESMVNHYLFPTKTELYIHADDFAFWHNFLVSERALVGGGNMRLRWYDDQVLYNSFFVNGYRIVSIPQLIVDLLKEGGVAVQAAEMMMEKYNNFLQLNHRQVIHLSGFMT